MSVGRMLRFKCTYTVFLTGYESNRMLVRCRKL